MYLLETRLKTLSAFKSHKKPREPKGILRRPKELKRLQHLQFFDKSMLWFLESGDPLEVEIRGCSIEAVERIVTKVNEKLKSEDKSVNAIQMDNFLWGFRREKAEEMLKFPYHRVRSIYYWNRYVQQMIFDLIFDYWVSPKECSPYF